MSGKSESKVERRGRARWAPFALLPALVVAMVQGGRTAAAPPEASLPSQAASLAPAGWLDSVQHDLEEQEYELSWQDSPVVDDIEPSWHAPNRAQGFRTYFTSEGIRVVPRGESAPTWRWGLSLIGYGDGEKTWKVPGANLASSGHRMAYHRGAFEEFYLNSPEGLEQGFILPAPPGSSGAGEAALVLPGLGKGVRRADSRGLVHVDLALWGDLSPRISEDGQAIDFVTPAGAPVLHYAQLKVTDARGSMLVSWMEGFAGEGVRGIRLVLDAEKAVYPITIDPLSTGWAWTDVGGQANVYYGDSVSTAGDVNGDGYSDIVLAATHYDNGQTDEGRALLYLGSASGPSTLAAWTAEGGQVSAHFGYPVAVAGDVNGDGYADVLVGANGFDGSDSDTGRVYLYLGSAAGLATTPAWTADGDQAFAQFGVWAATAGDVNGDGYSDVVVAAWLYNNGEAAEGRAYLYLGSGSGLATSPAWTAEGNQVGARFGYPVATAGDVNGDGYADVVVGAHLYDNGETDEGRAYLYLGSASGLASTPTWTTEGNQISAQLGRSVSPAGDVNGDGYADVVVGAHLYDNGQTDEGRAYLYRGNSSGLGVTPAWTAESNQANARFGVSVATGGDINGDGYADVLVGAELFVNGETNEGRAYLYLGSAGALSNAPAWTAESDQAGAQFGQVVATAGDVNGDGYSDVIVGAPNFDNTQFDEGRAYLYLGSASGPATFIGWQAGSVHSDAHFGFSVATAGDVNGDGFGDVIVGCPYCDNGEPAEGRAFVYLGAATGLSLTLAWAAESNIALANFGSSVATAGDVNGDGFTDLVVGAPAPPGSFDAGRWMLYFGSPSGPSLTPDFTSAGENGYGIAVGTAGDTNGDGYDDVLVGFVNHRGEPAAASQVFLFYGASSFPSAATSFGIVQQTAHFGSSVGTAGDVNGDGYSDIIIGAPEYSNDQSGEGAAYFYLGSASGVTSTPSWSVEGNQSGAQLGRSVATAGDVNGDGYADVIVGLPGYDAALNGQGRALVYLGSASGLSPSPAWVSTGNQSGEGLGSSVATAGDVNGDGYADVILGASGWDNGESDEGRAHVYLGSVVGLDLFPAWSAESNKASAGFGKSVSTAGDVNGDGYADIIIGADSFDNGPTQIRAGRAFAYSGNGGGRSVRPQQRRADDSAPIAPGGKSNAPGAFRLTALGRTPFGRGRLRLEWEVKPLGTLFNGLSTQQSATPLDTGITGVSLNELVSGINPGVHHWRVRLLFDAAGTPLAQKSRWFTVPWNGWQESDLRLGASLGGWAWDDLDGDGARELGEPGRGGVVVNLLNGGGATVGQSTTLADGSYSFGLPGPGSFRLQFTTPGGYVFTLQDQGGDDTVDSDASPASGLTALAGPSFTAADGSGWSAGLLACGPLALPSFITGARPDPSVTGIVIVVLDFTDPNPPGQALGYNVYRAVQPQPPPAPWTLVGNEVSDADPVTPNIQWIEAGGSAPPLGGVFYYKVAASNHVCGTEGPL